MATKYKSVLKGYKQILKAAYDKTSDPNKTRSENMQKALNTVAKLLKEQEDVEGERIHASLAAIAMKALIDDMNKELTHYFVKDKSLIEFLKNTEVKDTSIVREYVTENQRMLTTDSQIGYFTIALHTEDEGYVFSYINNTDHTAIAVFDSTNSYSFTLGNNVSDQAACQLAINLIYYMKAFPDKIIEGVPGDMVRNDKKIYVPSNCHTLGIADEIVEKTEVIDGRFITPHFRSGFFRHYTDDRYVNVKGKVQFIAATFVKGKAKTVVA